MKESKIETQSAVRLCCCGAPATGLVSGGEPRCCATCCFHPCGCRCKYGDTKDTVNDGPFAFEETFNDPYD